MAANPIYGTPAAVNAFAQGLRTVRPEGRVLLRWACLQDPDHPLDFADQEDVELFYARDPRSLALPTGIMAWCRRLPDGSVQPLGAAGVAVGYVLHRDHPAPFWKAAGTRPAAAR